MKWVTVWGNATSVADHRPETYAKDLTLRYPFQSAFGGNSVRLHFSNYCGTEPVTLSQVSIAPSISTREIDQKGVALVTFGGKESVTIGAGEEMVSDEIEMRVKDREWLAVSFYLKDYTLMRSGVVITGPLSKGSYSLGNQTLSDILPLNTTRTTNTYYFLTGVDVLTKDDNHCVICYGDSITSQSWPDYLAIQLMDDPYNKTAVVRRAASGTRVLREYTCMTYESYGLSGKHRFEREISTVSGAEAVIIQQGINDIIHPVGTNVNPFRPMSDLPTDQELQEGIVYYLTLAKKYRLKSYLGTLLPIYGWRTYAPFREDMKNTFNRWVKTEAPADHVIDFASALCDSENPAAFAQGYDSGDHLHPSEEAYRVMAQSAFDALTK
jgi:lysophospholipase L1-like esterase